MIFFSAVALAAPDRVATALFDNHDIAELALSSDGEMLAASDGTGTIMVADVYAWATSEATVGCTTVQGLAVAWYSGSWRVYAGCSDGGISVSTMDAYGRLDDEVEFATVASAASVYALETDDSYVYAVYDDGDGGLAVSAFSIADGAEWTTYYPITVNHSKVVDSAYVDGTMFVSHGNDDMSKVTTTTGDVVIASETMSGRDFGDLWAYNSSLVYIADTKGDLVSMNGSNDLSLVKEDVGTELNGVAVNADEAWMVLATADTVYTYGYDGYPAEEQAVLTVTGVGELIAAEGYALGASPTGVVVMTDRPWVDGVSLSPTSAGSGTEVTVSFTPDMAGTWSVNAGSGDSFASGSADAGEAVTTSFTVGSSLDEGDHRIYVDYIASGLTGTGSAILTVNNPPDGIILNAEDVLPGNESIHIDLDGFDSDVTYIDVYLETFPWDSADFPAEGGPDYQGPDNIQNPVSVAVTDGVTEEIVVSGLTNDTTYYVAVRARDSSGLEGSMSEVIPVTPQATYTMLDYYDDETPFCGVTGGSAGLAGLIAGLSLAFFRRARPAAVALTGVALLGAPSIAHARDADLTPRKWDLEVRYGAIINQSDPYITGAFGESGNSMFRLDYGWCSNLLEFDFGTGIYHDSGTLLTESGGATGDKTFLTVLPFELSLTGRLDFLDEQPAVPFARIGAGYSLFIQDWQEYPSEDLYESRAGGRFGWFWGAGVMFLLDGLDRSAASALEATAGINDTYIVAEYRSNMSIMVDDNVDLSQNDLTFGLKFDF